MYCDILIDNIVVMQLFRNSDYGTVTVNMPSAFGADSKLVNACGLTRDDLIQSFNKIEESINSDKLVTLFIDKASELTKIKEVADILEISKFAIMKLSKKSESDFSDKSKLVINLPAIAKLIETNMTKVSTISLSDYEAALSHIETSSVANRYVNGTAIVTLYSINYNNDKLPMFETSSLNGKKNAKDSYSVALSHGLTSLGIPSSIARQMQSDRPKGFLDNVDEIRNHLIYLYKKHVK